MIVISSEEGEGGRGERRTGRDVGLDDRDLEVRARGREVVRAREARAPRTDDDNVRDRALVQCGKVPMHNSRQR